MAVNVSSVPLIGAPTNFEELEQAFASLQQWLGVLNTSFEAVTAQLAAGDIILQAARADVAINLVAADVGTLYFVTDFNHFVRWSGTAWTFMDGGNRFFADHETAPGVGWGLCDGSTYNVLTVGATLTTSSFVTPNLSGSPAYKKSGAAYAGITAASGSTGTGTSGNQSADHTHTFSATTGLTNPGSLATDDNLDASTAGRSPQHDHAVSGTTGTQSASHTHSVPALAVGTVDMARLTVLPYFRL